MWISLKQVDILTLSYSQRTAVGITNSGGLDNHAFMYRVTHKGWDFREEYTESKLCFLTLMIYCNCKFCCFCLTNRYIILFKPIIRAEDICELEIVTLKEFQIVRKVWFFVNNPVLCILHTTELPRMWLQSRTAVYTIYSLIFFWHSWFPSEPKT